MTVESIRCVWFSPTGTTEQVITTIGTALSQKTGLPMTSISLTCPQERQQTVSFQKGDLVLAGFPTYAGKLPNKLLPEFQRLLVGNGALAVPVVLYGNRGYDHALAELQSLLETNGFQTIAAATFPARHAFTDVLAGDRPNDHDRLAMAAFAEVILENIRHPHTISVPGNPDAPYYIPKGTDGNPVNFLKAKPNIRPGHCTGCGLCAERCPMGSINPKDVTQISGVCIKCHSCVRNCPCGARYFDDPGFLSHVKMLEANFQDPKSHEVFR